MRMKRSLELGGWSLAVVCFLLAGILVLEVVGAAVMVPFSSDLSSALREVHPFMGWPETLVFAPVGLGTVIGVIAVVWALGRGLLFVSERIFGKGE